MSSVLFYRRRALSDLLSPGILCTFQIEAQKVRSALSQIKPVEDFKSLPRVPCVRNSLLLGMTTLGGVAGISAVAGRGLQRSLHWGVGGFVFVSLASFTTCRQSRQAEKARMKMIVESYQRGPKQQQPNPIRIENQTAQR